MRAFIELAVRLGAIIQATDPAVAKARDAEFRASGPTMFDFPPATARTRDLDGGTRRRAGMCSLSRGSPTGRRLDDAVGNRFVVLSALPLDARTRRAGGEGRRGGLGLAFIDAPGPAVEEWLAAREAVAVIVRPDRYVFALARDQADVPRALEALASRLRQRSVPAVELHRLPASAGGCCPAGARPPGAGW